jgi:hypothetical protein
MTYRTSQKYGRRLEQAYTKCPICVPAVIQKVSSAPNVISTSDPLGKEPKGTKEEAVIKGYF